MADSSNEVKKRAFRKRPSSSLHSQRRPTPAKRPANASSTQSSPFSTTPPLSAGLFRELVTSNINPDLLKSVTKAKGLTSMTVVQAETLPVTLAGHDVLAQAKTGTGKTIAFILPAIQRLIETRPFKSSQRPSGPGAAPRQTSLLVITPTRELALQIAAEAKILLDGLTFGTDQKTPYKIMTAIGGTNKSPGLKALKQGCDIVIATPGRLLDYMEDENALRILHGVQTLVLDEADRLLDMGFIRDVRKIMAQLPDRQVHQRQGMLFSATMDAKVNEVAHLVLSPSHKVINTIPEGEAKTHERVSQRLITVDSFADLAPATVGAIAKDLASCGSPETFKAIVFLPTTLHVDLFFAMIEGLSWQYKFPKVLPTHGRLSQAKRTRTTNEYRESQNGILVATDVIARGMDFPNVTHIYQAGLPDDKASYIHRLGRTARAGADGNGTLLLTRDESSFAKKDLAEIDFNEEPSTLGADSSEVKDAMEKIDPELRQRAYRSFLGYYKGKLKELGFDRQKLVALMNKFAEEGMFLSEIPEMDARLAKKMGLDGVRGLRISAKPAARKPAQEGRKPAQEGRKLKW